MSTGQDDSAGKPHRSRISRRRLIAAGIGAAVVGGSLTALHQPGGAIVPGRPRARPVQGDETIPSAVDIVVIGGGYVGCATALTLAERGVSVALCEKGVIAGEASGRSTGIIDSLLLDPVKQELIGRSKELWAGMNARTGLETGYRLRGQLMMLDGPEAVGGVETWIRVTRGMPGVDARIIGRKEISALTAGASRSWDTAVYQGSDAVAEPTLAAPAMADAARRLGANVLQNCAVRGVEHSAGRISGVVTEKGPIRCKTVVLAGGAWSPLFAGSLGLDLPQFQAHASMMSVEPVTAPTVTTAVGDHMFRAQHDGGYAIGKIFGAVPITPSLIRHAFQLWPAIRALWFQAHPVFSPSTFWTQLATPSHWPLDRLSPFEANRILMPEMPVEILDSVRPTLGRDFPVFADARERERWTGVLTTTSDNMPVISPVTSQPGLILGTGFYYGLTMAAAAGEALADLATGRRPQIDLSLYRYERFIDGSPLTFRD